MVSNIASCVSTAYQAGFKYVDVYVYLCPECGGQNPPTSMANTLASLHLKVNYVWLDVEPCGGGCWTNAAANVPYLHAAVSAFQANGFKVGIYSSEGSWGVMGGSTAFSNLPLWYAHFDGVASFSDANEGFATFGGWSSTPVFKQYVGDTTLCGVGVDLDYTPTLPSTAPPPPPAPLPSGCLAEYSVSATTGVNFRTSPSTSATILATLSLGTIVYQFTSTVTAADGYNWIEVQYNSQNGYIADEYLTKVMDCTPPPPPPVYPTYCVTAQPNLRLRSTACTTGTILASMPTDASVDSLSSTLTTACGYNWRHVSYNGQTGYAADEFLKACTLGKFDVNNALNVTDTGVCMTTVGAASALSVNSILIVAIAIVALAL